MNILVNKSVSGTKALLSFFLIIYSVPACNKIVQIPPPKNSITTSQVFKDSADAISALAGIYSNMSSTRDIGFCNGAQTIYCGMSADELIDFSGGNDGAGYQFQTNTLISSNGSLEYYLWRAPYAFIYQANACIEGTLSSNTLEQSVKNEVLGEAKFLRALNYFYMVNLYGDVPYVTSTAWEQTATSYRTPKDSVYKAIIADLTDAQSKLPEDFSYGEGNRVRANKWTATALLARVYLYTSDFKDAVVQASAVISNNLLFSLEPDLNKVFLINSSEAILQWQLNTKWGYSNLTAEGANLNPIDSTYNPNYYLTPQLLNSFEANDNRKSAWIGKNTYAGIDYYYPFKYKVSLSQEVYGGIATEYYVVLRLAEQYLIRAEASALSGDLTTAINDLNTIRQRAGLPNLSSGLNKSSVISAIAQERKIELFAEWGHRWLDLKRTGQAGPVLVPIKPQWQDFQQFYPIPLNELSVDHNLTQNEGY